MPFTAALAIEFYGTGASTNPVSDLIIADRAAYFLDSSATLERYITKIGSDWI
jgi:hypothetical protein